MRLATLLVMAPLFAAGCNGPRTEILCMVPTKAPPSPFNSNSTPGR
jgi:hypothetical protein